MSDVANASTKGLPLVFLGELPKNCLNLLAKYQDRILSRNARLLAIPVACFAE